MAELNGNGKEPGKVVEFEKMDNKSPEEKKDLPVVTKENGEQPKEEESKTVTTETDTSESENAGSTSDSGGSTEGVLKQNTYGKYTGTDPNHFLTTINGSSETTGLLSTTLVKKMEEVPVMLTDDFQLNSYLDPFYNSEVISLCLNVKLNVKCENTTSKWTSTSVEKQYLQFFNKNKNNNISIIESNETLINVETILKDKATPKDNFSIEQSIVESLRGGAQNKKVVSDLNTIENNILPVLLRFSGIVKTQTVAEQFGFTFDNRNVEQYKRNVFPIDAKKASDSNFMSKYYDRGFILNGMGKNLLPAILFSFLCKNNIDMSNLFKDKALKSFCIKYTNIDWDQILIQDDIYIFTENVDKYYKINNSLSIKDIFNNGNLTSLYSYMCTYFGGGLVENTYQSVFFGMEKLFTSETIYLPKIKLQKFSGLIYCHGLYNKLKFDCKNIIFSFMNMRVMETLYLHAWTGVLLSDSVQFDSLLLEDKAGYILDTLNRFHSITKTYSKSTFDSLSFVGMKSIIIRNFVENITINGLFPLKSKYRDTLNSVSFTDKYRHSLLTYWVMDKIDGWEKGEVKYTVFEDKFYEFAINESNKYISHYVVQSSIGNPYNGSYIPTMNFPILTKKEKYTLLNWDNFGVDVGENKIKLTKPLIEVISGNVKKGYDEIVIEPYSEDESEGKPVEGDIFTENNELGKGDKLVGKEYGEPVQFRAKKEILLENPNRLTIQDFEKNIFELYENIGDNNRCLAMLYFQNSGKCILIVRYNTERSFNKLRPYISNVTTLLSAIKKYNKQIAPFVIRVIKM